MMGRGVGSESSSSYDHQLIYLMEPKLTVLDGTFSILLHTNLTLTKREVKLVGCWPDSFFFFCFNCALTLRIDVVKILKVTVSLLPVFLEL